MSTWFLERVVATAAGGMTSAGSERALSSAFASQLSTLRDVVRTVTRIGAVLFVFGAAMWFAEDPLFTVVMLAAARGHASSWVIFVVFVALLSCAALGVVLMRVHAWPLRLAGAIIALAAAALGFLAGDYTQRRAYNRCVEDATLLQTRIDDFQRRHRRYPISLAELGEVPCRRVLRGTILNYERTAAGYQLGFHDWLVTWRGSEREPITATK